MGYPTASDLHVNGLLTDLSVSYMQDPKNFKGHMAASKVRVKKQSDKYGKWSQADYMRLQMQARADGDSAAEASYKFDSTGTYFCDTFAVKKLQTERVRKNYDVPLNADEAAVKFLTQQALMKREALFVAALMGTSLWDTDYTGASSTSGTDRLYWDNASSDPLLDVSIAKRLVQKEIGHMPNVMVVGPDLFDTLALHADLKDIVKYTQKGVLTEELIAEAFGIEKFLVCESVYNSAAADATVSMAHQVGSNAALFYAPDTAQLDEPTGAAMFTWDEIDGLPDDAVQIRKWEDPERRGEWFEAQISVDFAITSTVSGVYFDDMIT